MRNRVLRLSQTHYMPEQQRLLNIMLEPSYSPIDRAKAGRAINRVGDPRPGVLDFNLKVDDYWCLAPTGKYPLGSDDEKHKNPKHIADLSAFYIAKYPITYAQFELFRNADDGFVQERWWQGIPNRPVNPDYNIAHQKRKIANHPREMVSWYEAVAFCRWLSAQLGYEVRLPTDDEWESAARGTDEREFPWGNGYQFGYANVDERSLRPQAGPNNLGHTTAVGLYPQGVSPCGALDLIGNVWEWTSTEIDVNRNIRMSLLSVIDTGDISDFSKEQVNLFLSGTVRSVRGGPDGNSCGKITEFLYTSFRTNYFGLHPNFPTERSFGLGFRLVSTAPCP